MKPVLSAVLCAFVLVAVSSGGVPSSSGARLVAGTSDDGVSSAFIHAPEPLMATDCDVMLPDSVGRPTLCELVLSEEGLGPIVLGQTVPSTAPEAAIVSGRLALCGDSEYFQWEPNYPWTPKGNPAFYVASWGENDLDPIIHMYVWSALIHTAEGIHVGSAVSELQADYGVRLEFFPAAEGAEFSGYSLKGSVGRIVFWVYSLEPDAVSGIELVMGHEAPQFYYSLGCG